MNFTIKGGSMEALFKTVSLILIVFFMFNVSAVAADKKNFSATPTTNDGQKWRIGYSEGGEYVDYQKSLIATVKRLMEMGWIEEQEIPPQSGFQTKELWKWLASKARSNYLQFVEDFHYSAGWDKKLRKKTAAEIIRRLKDKQIDLLLALGTWTGQDIANNQHNVPTVVMSASNALSSGIIKSIEDSGYDHILARMDPFRDERQISIFHDVIEFRKLGLAYENTSEGKSYAALKSVEKIAKERGFEIVSCYIAKESESGTAVEEQVKQCFEKLGKSAEAIYVTVQPLVSNPKAITDWVKIFNSHRIPTFSQSGSDEVKYGLLMSISHGGFKYVGRYYAEVISKICNGAKPRQLDQVFEGPPKIAINLKTAVIIGYDPPVDVLGVADEIYQEIQDPK